MKKTWLIIEDNEIRAIYLQLLIKKIIPDDEVIWFYVREIFAIPSSTKFFHSDYHHIKDVASLVMQFNKIESNNIIVLLDISLQGVNENGDSFCDEHSAFRKSLVDLAKNKPQYLIALTTQQANTGAIRERLISDSINEKFILSCDNVLLTDAGKNMDFDLNSGYRFKNFDFINDTYITIIENYWHKIYVENPITAYLKHISTNIKEGEQHDSTDLLYKEFITTILNFEIQEFELITRYTFPTTRPIPADPISEFLKTFLTDFSDGMSLMGVFFIAWSSYRKEFKHLNYDNTQFLETFEKILGNTYYRKNNLSNRSPLHSDFFRFSSSSDQKGNVVASKSRDRLLKNYLLLYNLFKNILFRKCDNLSSLEKIDFTPDSLSFTIDFNNSEFPEVCNNKKFIETLNLKHVRLYEKLFSTNSTGKEEEKNLASRSLIEFLLYSSFSDQNIHYMWGACFLKVFLNQKQQIVLRFKI